MPRIRIVTFTVLLATIGATSCLAANDSPAVDRISLVGSWKRDCRDGFGLRIAHVRTDLYSISFCGPGGCFEPGTYRPNSPIYGDGHYRVLDSHTIEVSGRDGWSRYQRCEATDVPQAVNAATASRVEDSLARIVLGSHVSQLFEVYRGLYAQGMTLGEVLYEACNQSTLTVFTFVEVPWSRGYITRIIVEKAEDSSICRDEEGSLPNTSTAPSTSKGLTLGDPIERVRELYGPPIESKERGPKTTLIYRFKGPEAKDARIKNPVMSVTVQGNVVTRMSLSGDIPGARKPIEKSE
jgi:hypothetical protein